MSQPAPAGDGESRDGIMRRVTGGIDRRLRMVFFRLGYFIAHRPWLIILVMLVISLGAVAGVLRLKSESRGEKLWVPQGSRAQDEKRVVDAKFGSYRRFSQLLFVGKNDGDDIGTRAALLSLVDVLGFADGIEGGPVPGPDGDNTPTTYQERCIKTFDSVENEYCSRVSALDLFYDAADAVEVDGKADYLATVKEKLTDMTDADVRTALLSDAPVETFYGVPLIRDDYIARDGDKVTGFLVQQIAENNLKTVDGKDVDAESDSWEEAWAEQLNAEPAVVESDTLIWYTDTVKGGEDALETALFGDLSKFAVGIVLLAIYVVLFMGEFHTIESRMVLGLVSILTAGLSLGITYGLSSLVGWFYGPVHSILPLLLIGVAVDDMFVVTRSLSDVNRSNERISGKDIPTRIGLALSKSGTAITVTSLTNFLVFLVSAVSRLPALRYFSLWACVGVIADYLLSITLFVAALTLDQRRIDAKRRDCCACFPPVKDPKEKNWFKMDFGVFNRFFGKRFGPLILSRYARLAVLLFFTGILAAGSYGASQIYLKFKLSFFYPSGTDQRRFQDALDTQFQQAQPSFVYVRNIDFSTAENQRKFLALCRADDGVVAKSEWVLNESVDCWYEALRESESISGDDLIPVSEFSDTLTSFLKGPGAQYASNVVRDGDGKVTISRFGLNYKYADTNDEEIDRLETLREDVTAAGYTEEEAFPYDYSAIFVEQFIALPKEIMVTLILSILAVGVVTFLLIGNPLVGLLSMLVVGLILVEVVGFMNFSGYNLNSVSVISLSVSVGFACDNVVHIARSFLEQVGTRRERSIKALEELGPPVFHAVFSTFIAIMALSAASSYIFKSLFSGFCSLLILAAAHGLILLPVLLSLLGPNGFYRTEEEKEMEELRLEEAALSTTAAKGVAEEEAAGKDVVVE